MGKLFQESIQALPQSIIFGHYFLKHCIFFIDGDINMIVGQINFKRFGFNFHSVFFLNDAEIKFRCQVSDKRWIGLFGWIGSIS
jgi:hypothetical protein